MRVRAVAPLLLSLPLSLPVSLPISLPMLGAAEDEGITIDHWGPTTLLVSAPDLRQDPAVLHRLAAEVTLDLADASLAEVATFLSRTEGINVVIDPALRASDPHLTLKVQHMSVDHVLHWVCELAHCHWTAQHGAIFLSEKPAEGARRMVLYDVADLLSPVRDFPGPELAFNAGSEKSGPRFLAPVPETKDEPPSIDQVEEMLRKLLGAASP